ncbi:MAG: DUF5606 domain-containing protein [Bacteroidales bacterium]
MDLSKIVSISGKPGLFLVTGQGKSNVIVESLIDGKRFPAFLHDKMSSLEEISIFTEGDDRPLKEVFKKIHTEMGVNLEFDVKKLNQNQLKEKFETVVPDYNTEAVYPSDMKKVFTWYQMLVEKNLLDFSETSEIADAETVEETKEL